jgi:subtilisin family serine protease
MNFGLILIMMLSMLAINPGSASAKPALEVKPGTFVPGQLVVGFDEGLTAQAAAAQASALAGSVGAQVLKTSGSVALLGFDPAADVAGLAAQVSGQTGVKFAEANYLYTIPETDASAYAQGKQPTMVVRKTPEKAKGQFGGKDYFAVPIAGLKAMTTKTGTTIKAVYPNDPYLWWGGWDTVNASMVAPNLTPSANVCVIDTGVDYLHPDLAIRMIKGYDYVNDDADPMDDHGHGTHVAGIIAAVQGNAIGLAGVSTGKVVAMKALNAQGSGTNYDIAQAIIGCANRLDVKVISMSLGGPGSIDTLNAVNYAVNTKGKLVVAAAGNSGTSSTTYAYPAAFALTFPGKVLAVGASGQFGFGVDYWCQAQYSNYGSWVSVVAPGSDIYSTLPYDKPFYMHYYYGMDTRYGGLSGTSMATPYVAAAAARRWGYKPLTGGLPTTNLQVGQAVIDSGQFVDADGTCWDTSMAGRRMVDVASLLERGAASAASYDAVTGLPLNGAQILAVKNGLTVGSALITPFTWKADPTEVDPTRIYSYFTAWTDILNLPAGGWYQYKVNKAGYTAAPTVAYMPGWSFWASEGRWNWGGRSAIPPKNGNFTSVLYYETAWRDDFVVHSPSFNEPWDLDLYLWLPITNPFVVGLGGSGMGTMLASPFANLRREGGWSDWLQVETIVFKNRTGPGLVANAGAPMYTGMYAVGATDWGQTIDHDNDGCGDNYGYGFNPAYTCVGTQGIPLLGSYYIPYMTIWKDGVIKKFVDSTEGNGYNLWGANTYGNQHWWSPVQITTTTPASLPSYNAVNSFSNTGSIFPYAGLDMSTSSIFKK